MHVFITGAAGRLGQILQKSWAQGGQQEIWPIWSARTAAGSVYFPWDILSDTLPAIPTGAIVLHLAGVLRGDGKALSANTAMALKVCDAANAVGAKHVFIASSAAVYGGADGDLSEDHAPHPALGYGCSKLQMENDVLNWLRNAGQSAPKITLLRIGNVLGADALFGGDGTPHIVTLDPVAGHDRGPLRPYIGPQLFGSVVLQLLKIAAAGGLIPKILNVASLQPVFMADLLGAAKRPFVFGPPRGQVIAKVSLSTARLAGLMSLPAQDPSAMIADWNGLQVCQYDPG